MNKVGSAPANPDGRARPASASSSVVTLVVASASFFMVCLDVTIVNIALPTLSRRLGASLQELQWIVDGYALVFAAALLSGGALGDRRGSRRVFAQGLALFTVASAACGLAPSTGALIAARFVQGLGAALLVPCSLTLLRQAYDDDKARARAVAAWSAAGAAAIAAGPVFGGVLIGAFGWRSIFLVNVAVGSIALAVTLVRVRATTGARGRVDLAGQAAAITAIGGLIFALIEGPRLGWAAPAVLAAIAALLIGIVVFVRVESRVPQPMLPLALARRPEFAGAALVGGLLNLAFYGEVFVLSLFFQQAQRDTALQAGLSFLPMTALIMAANLTAPRAAERLGSVRTIIIGQLIFAAGLAAALTVGVHSHEWAVALALLPIGIGAGLSIPPLTSRLLESIPPTLAGVASGAFNASRQVGGAIGVALFGALLAGSRHSFIAGMRLTLLAALIAALAAVVLTKVLVSRTPR